MVAKIGIGDDVRDRYPYAKFHWIRSVVFLCACAPGVFRSFGRLESIMDGDKVEWSFDRRRAATMSELS